MRGYQCPKSIYLTVHHKELEPPITPAQQAVFDQGNEVGLEARKRFPSGVLVDNQPWDFGGSLKRTRELLAAHTPVIFEAAFEYKGAYARADVIQYSPQSGRWTIYEVKSSTKVKPEHLDDVGLQAWIMVNSGLPIEQINLMHLNPSCRHPDLSNLFSVVDVTSELRDRYLGIAPKLNGLMNTLRQESVPEVDIGPHCDSPNPCPFKEHCWKEKGIPELSVFRLPKIGDRAWELYQNGIVALTDERISELAPEQSRIVEGTRSQSRFVDVSGLREAMKDWKFPLVFLDFETINPAIPRYPGTGPYQQVPFQFSAHIWRDADSPLEHREYLHTDASDPRPHLIPSLLEVCGVHGADGTFGSIVAYYAKFEKDCIQGMADSIPEFRSQLEALLPRFVDPLPILRDFVYDPQFNASFSLKDVAPALLGRDASYEGMMVAEGTAAQRAFTEFTNPSTPENRRSELIQASLEYCRKDTLVMVDLVKWLRNL